MIHGEATLIKFSEYFYYSEDSKSCLKWKVSGRFKGDLKDKDAGSLDAKGYYRVKVNGKSYKVHRIVYCLHNPDFDYLSKNMIDHKDTVRSHNKILNLREVDRKGNAKNVLRSKRNKTGVTGVNLKMKGNVPVAYRATWRNLDSKPDEKSFSINKYGDELAFFMASEYRNQQILLLNLEGAGYSENHGK